MENIKQEIFELHKEVTTLKDGMEYLIALVESLVSSQVNPSRKEEDMEKVFTEILKSFFHERVIVNTPSDFPKKSEHGSASGRRYPRGTFV